MPPSSPFAAITPMFCRERRMIYADAVFDPPPGYFSAPERRLRAVRGAQECAVVRSTILMRQRYFCYTSPRLLRGTPATSDYHYAKP